jgi:single-strand DNA-binding protein
MNETYATVVGNVSSAVSRRQTADGTPVANFRMISNERRRDRVSGEWVDGDRLYVEVTCWRRLADNVDASIVLGDPVVVTGRIHTREYEVASGERRSVMALEAHAVGAELSRCRATILRPQRRTGEEGITAAVEAPAPAPQGPDVPTTTPVERGPLVAVTGGGGA